MLSQEIETFYLIPAIRKSLVEYMIKKKIEKKKIAENLNLTKSAISQYVSKKRVKNFVLSEDIIQECCDNILKGRNYISEIQKLIYDLKKSKTICQIYKNNNLVPDDCKVCENASVFR